MQPSDVIKSYLVSLGFKIDDPSLRQFEQVIKDINKKIVDSANDMSKDYAIAAGSVVGSLALVAAATVSLVNHVAQADLGYRKFAMHMFMGTDAAKQMKIAVDALGESLDDIAWMPELRGRYNRLIHEERGMDLPKDFESQFRYIRDVRFEFTRLKAEITYGMQWVGYHLIKGLAEPIAQGHAGFKSLNDWLQKNMPEWSSKIAEVLGVFVRLTISVVRGLSDVIGSLGVLVGWFRHLYSEIPRWEKALLAAAAAIALAFGTGPIGRAVSVISTLILLIDDFYAFIDGRKSSKTLAPIWTALIMAGDTVVRLMTAAAVLIDDIFSGNHRSIKDIIADVKGAYTDIEGLTPLLDKQNPETPPSNNQTGPSENEVMDAAKSVSSKTGIRPEWIFAQWYHETGGFKSNQAINLHNLGGIKQAGQFRKFDSVQDFAEHYASMMNNPKWANVRHAQDLEHFIGALRMDGYFEKSDYPSYAADLPKIVEQFAGKWNSGVSPTIGAASGGDITNYVNLALHFHGPADEESVRKGATDALKRSGLLLNRQMKTATP